jgi:hypothetical protein
MMQDYSALKVFGYPVGKLLNIFVDICLLRAGPQDLPASGFLLVVTALLGLLTGALVIVESFGSVFYALLAQLLDLLLLVSLLRTGLAYRGLATRFPQAATALFGSSALINLVTMPVQLLIGEDPSASLGGELGVLFYLFLLVWALVVIGHIVRHSFDIRFSGGILIALAYFLLINWLVQIFFPVA